jgi:hypothetical protein
MRPAAILLLSFSIPLSACGPTYHGDDLADADCVGDECERSGPLAALCRAQVLGRGEVDVESFYLPRVVACENPNGGMESLKAQAIAARTYLHYVARTERRSIRDGQGDQVMSCGRSPRPEHFLAVQATSGQVLRYRGTRVASFYVAGANQSGPSCRGGTSDPTRTERYVTYNEGRTGTGVIQTSLGFRHPSNHANRGCMSQHGANCLAARGRSVDAILRFYYGADIEVVQTQGPCVEAAPDPLEDPEAWIGDACAGDQECPFSSGGEDGSCHQWFDEDTGELEGFCSLGCEGLCPDLLGHAPALCVELLGAGRCVVESAAHNGHCAEVAGTEPMVMARYTGASGAPAAYREVCAPPHAAEVTCSVGGVGGVCIDTSKSPCGGTVHTGYCPGPANIRCCTP